MEIIDTYSSALTSYDGSGFSFDLWKNYIDAVLPGSFQTLVEDAKNAQCNEEFSNKYYLSVLDHVMQDPQHREFAHNSFLQATENLERIIYEHFGKNLDVIIVFYLGLCNGAGWKCLIFPKSRVSICRSRMIFCQPSSGTEVPCRRRKSIRKPGSGCRRSGAPQRYLPSFWRGTPCAAPGGYSARR